MLVIDVYSHRFEVFTLVSEIHYNVDLVLGMKNVFELEAIIDMQGSSFKFLNRSIPFFSKEQIILKPKGKKFIKIEAPFIDVKSGLAMVKNVGQQRTMYGSVETKVHKKPSIVGHYKQYTKDSNIRSKRHDRHFRFEILRFLQNKVGSTAATFEQILSFWTSR